MNYKTILLASAAVMFAGAATAEDFTGSLYLPSQGKVLSDTSFVRDRVKFKNNAGVAEGVYLQEQMTYGVTDNFSVVGMIGNHFDWAGWTNQEFNNDHNFDYGLGVKYNMRHNRIVGQVGVGYYTYNPKSFFGHRGNDSRWYKQINGNAQLGYELCDGLTPYTSIDISGNIDEADRELWYSWFLGAHKTWEKFALDGGVRYDFKTDGSNKNSWFLQAEANYFVTDNMAVGVFGDYYLGGSDYVYNTVTPEIDYGYTAGVNFKVVF